MKIVPAVSLFFLPLLIAGCTAVEYGMNDSMPPPSAVVETAADTDGWRRRTARPPPLRPATPAPCRKATGSSSRKAAE